MEEENNKGEVVVETRKGNPTRVKNPLKQFFLGLFGILIIAVLGVYVYTMGQIRELSSAPFVMQSAATLHIPIAKVDGTAIQYTDFMNDYQSLLTFYSGQPEGFPVPTDKDIAEQVLSRLIINTKITSLAKKYGVVIEQENIDIAKAELLSQFPDEATAAAEIQKTFGWNLETFTNRVIRPIVLEQKVATAFSTDESVDESYKAPQVKGRHILFLVQEGTEEVTMQKAQAVLDRIKNGEDFAELAKEFGADGTAEVGGDLGWIDKGVTVPAFEEVLFSLAPGELYESVARTEFGYHIIQADEVRTLNDFSQYFQSTLAEASISIYADLANPFAVKEQPEVTEDLGVMEVVEDTETATE